MLDKKFLASIPSDYGEQRREGVKKRNNLNRSRSKTQEREVAKFLGGNRVPMSGAGMLKGDGIWSSPFGLVIYECKYSAGTHKWYGPTLRFDYRWIPKFERDIQSMKAVFGFFCFHFHQQRGGYQNDVVIISEEKSKLFIPQEYIDSAPTWVREGNGMNVFRNQVDQGYELNPKFPLISLLTPTVQYVILPLWAMKELVRASSCDTET